MNEMHERRKIFFPGIKDIAGGTGLNLHKLSEKKQTFFCLGIPLLVSVLIKLVILAGLFDSAINNDGILYIAAAKHYSAGEFAKGLSLYPMPVYPILLALVHFIIPDWIVSGYFISCVSITLSAIPLYYLTKALFGIGAAFWASLIFAVLPMMNEWFLYLSRDPLFLLVSSSFIYWGLKSIREKGQSCFVLTFILAWASTLIRIEGCLFIIFYFCALAFLAVRNKELRPLFLMRAVIWAGIPLVVAMAVSFIYGIDALSGNRFGQVIPYFEQLFTGGFVVTYHEIYEFFKKAENFPPFSGGKCNFAALARHYLVVIYSFAIVETLLKVLFPLSIIPLFMGLKKKIKPWGMYLLSLCFLFMLLVFSFVLYRDFIVTRYLMIPAFLLLPWVGLGMNQLCLKKDNRKYTKIVAVSLSVLVLAPAVKSLNLIVDKDKTIPLAAKWMVNTEIKKNTRIVTTDSKFSFYMDYEDKGKKGYKVFYLSRKPEPKKIESFAVKRKAEFIVLRVNNKRVKNGPEFKRYQEIKSFSHPQYTTFIFEKIKTKQASSPRAERNPRP